MGLKKDAEEKIRKLVEEKVRPGQSGRLRFISFEQVENGGVTKIKCVYETWMETGPGKDLPSNRHIECYEENADGSMKEVVC